MKKIFAVLAILLVATAVLVACTPETSVLDLYSAINTATRATQKISVTKGSELLASEDLTYDFAAGKVTGTKKTLNASDAATDYTETAVERDVGERGSVSLSRDALSNIVEENNTLTATVANASLAELFGIDGSKVDGSATLQLKADGTHITGVTLSYTSTSGNSVSISTTYTY